jgi:competence protein ComEC
MKIRRPVIPLTIFLAAGIWAGKLIPAAFHFLPFLIALFTLSVVAAFVQKRRGRPMAAGVSFLLAFLMLGTILAAQRERQAEKEALPLPGEGKVVYVDGHLSEPATGKEGRGSFLLRAAHLGDASLPGGTLLQVHYRGGDEAPPLESLHYGRGVCFLAIPLPGGGSRNPGQFDFMQYNRQRGVSGSLFLVKWLHRDVNDKKSPFRDWVYATRARLVETVKSALPEPCSSLLLGIVLGRRAELSPRLENALVNTGTLHVIAASGLNVSIVAGFFLLAFRLARFSHPLRHLLIIPPLIFYALLAGGTPSITRATLMGALLLTALSIERDYDVLSALFFAALAMLFINPYNLFLVSFQLSFMAVLGIVLGFTPIRRLLPGKDGVRAWLKARWGDGPARLLTGIYEAAAANVVITIACYVALLPLLAYYFNRLSLVNLPANLLIVPAVALFLPMGLFGGVSGILFPCLGTAILRLLHLPLTLAIAVLQFLGEMPFASAPVPSPGVPFFVIYYSALALTLIDMEWLKKRRAAAVAILLAACVACLGGASIAGKMGRRVVIFDTSRKLSILIEGKEGNHLFLLGRRRPGEGTDQEVEREVAPYLLKRGISLDSLILAGRSPAFFPRPGRLTEMIPVKKILVCSDFADSPCLQGFLDAAGAKGIPVLQVRGEYCLNTSKGNDAHLRLRPGGDGSPLLLGYAGGNWRLAVVDYPDDGAFAALGPPKGDAIGRVMVFAGVRKKDKDKVAARAGEGTILINGSNLEISNIISPRKAGAIMFDLGRQGARQVDWRKKGYN